MITASSASTVISIQLSPLFWVRIISPIPHRVESLWCQGSDAIGAKRTIGSFQKGNLRPQSQGLHYPHKVADRRKPAHR